MFFTIKISSAVRDNYFVTTTPLWYKKSPDLHATMQFGLLIYKKRESHKLLHGPQSFSLLPITLLLQELLLLLP